MKTGKRIISIFLALVIAVTSLSVGFFAFAAQETKTDSVSEIEQAIDNWYSDYRLKMYSTKDADAEAKAAARKAYNEISDKMKNLNESDMLRIDLPHYAYWLTTVVADIARNNSANPAKTPSTADKCKVFETLSQIEDVMGAFPKDYKSAIDAYAPYSQKIGTAYLADPAKLNFKTNAQAAALFDELVNNIQNLSYTALRFSDYLAPSNSGGIYTTLTSVRNLTGNTAGTLVKMFYCKEQDLVSDKGTDPTKFSAGNYISRSGSSKTGYSYAWKSGKTAQDYLDGFDNYFTQYEKDIINPAIKAYQDTYAVLDNFEELKGLGSVDEAITSAGSKIINNENPSDKEVKDAVAKYNALNENAKVVFDALSSRSESKLLPYVKNPYTIETLTPELGYTKASNVQTYKLSVLLDKCQEFINNLMLNEFSDYVQKIDLNNLSEKIIKTAQEKYAALPGDFKNKITSEILDKFTQIVKPKRNNSNLSDQIKAFRKTKVVLPDNSPLANEKGGIQYAVDELWDLVADTLLPLVASDINLSKGLNNVLESKVYTNEMVSKIFSLYAMLSHNDSVVNESPKITLGTAVSMIASPATISNLLEEEKFSKAAEKIAAYKNYKAEGDMNEFDALASEKFVSGDFGFEDGDREGFFDALLAVLRPLTTLLEPGAKVAGLIAVNAHMFDYVNSDGEYVNGVYAQLIPLLEQLGLESLPTSSEYEKDFYSVLEEKGKNIAADRLLRPIIDCLLTDLVDMISPDPLNGLIKILPRAAYVISTDMLNNCVKSALGQLGILSGLANSIDISAKSINNALSSPIDLSSLAGKECTLKLKAVNWSKLANCATVKSVASASNSNAYFVLRTGDTETCFTTVFYYIYSVLFGNSENYSNVKELLNSLLGGAAGIVTKITDKFAGKDEVSGYEQFLNLFKAPQKELPELKINFPEIAIKDQTQEDRKNKINASKCTAKLSCKAFNYNGKVKKPSVSVKYKNKKLVNGRDYSVKYIGSRKDVGKYAVLISFDGKYTGTKMLYFTIKPKGTSIKSVSSGKKSITVKWNRKTSQMTGYQIQYSTSKKFDSSKTKTITIGRNAITSKKISKLKGKKKYYVRVRTYKNLGGAKSYSSWSKTKAIVTKR